MCNWDGSNVRFVFIFMISGRFVFCSWILLLLHFDEYFLPINRKLRQITPTIETIQYKKQKQAKIQKKKITKRK